MWYSIYSVGDVDIDQEHANIDFMLSALTPDDEHFREQMLNLLSALAQHFVNEEKIADARGYAMTDEHRRVHRELTEQLEILQDSLRTGEVSPVALTQNLQDILREHILEYDRYLMVSEST